MAADESPSLVSDSFNDTPDNFSDCIFSDPNSRIHLNLYNEELLNSSFELYNIIGQTIDQINLGSEKFLDKTFDYSKLPSGIYVALIRNESGILEKREVFLGNQWK